MPAIITEQKGLLIARIRLAEEKSASFEAVDVTDLMKPTLFFSDICANPDSKPFLRCLKTSLLVLR